MKPEAILGWEEVHWLLRVFRRGRGAEKVGAQGLRDHGQGLGLLEIRGQR